MWERLAICIAAVRTSAIQLQYKKKSLYCSCTVVVFHFCGPLYAFFKVGLMLTFSSILGKKFVLAEQIDIVSVLCRIVKGDIDSPLTDNRLRRVTLSVIFVDFPGKWRTENRICSSFFAEIKKNERKTRGLGLTLNVNHAFQVEDYTQIMPISQLRFDYDTTTTKNEKFTCSSLLASNRKQARAIRRSRIAVVS